MAVNITRAGDGVVTFDFGGGLDPIVLTDSNDISVTSVEQINSVGTIIRQDISFTRTDPYFYYLISYSQIGTINGGAKPAIGDDTTELFQTAVFQGVPPAGGDITASQITDSTAVGRSVITAVDATAARTAIGAGTSNLTIGTTGTTAKAGNYTPSLAEISTVLAAVTGYNAAETQTLKNVAGVFMWVTDTP